MITALINKDKYSDQRGIGLVETMMAVAILGTAVVAFIAALSTGSISVNLHQEETIAQRLAQNQIEYTKEQPFDAGGSYSLLAAPAGYTVTLDVAPVPDGDIYIQKITAAVLRDGSSIFEVSDYKVNR